MNCKRSIYSSSILNGIIFLSFVVSLIVSCEKLEPERIAKLPIVYTRAINNIIGNSAQTGGNVTNDGGATITARGVCWSISHNPTTAHNHTTDGSGTGNFTSTLIDLIPNAVYYVRAYATNSAGTAYGEEITYTFIPPLTVITRPVVDITATSARCPGEVVYNGGSFVTERGICWSTSQEPTRDDNYSPAGNGMGTFTADLTDLLHSTTYYARAYAINADGIVYGNEISFITPAPLTILTLAVNDITTNSATVDCNVTQDGGLTVIGRGVCYSQTPLPTLDDTPVSAISAGLGNFSVVLNSLTNNTTYYVRAYAINPNDTAYGDELSFKTWQGSVLDIDNNLYPTVVIGGQEWMAENLRVTKYNDATDINLVLDNLDWEAREEGAYCYYDNLNSNGDIYGVLYNWYAVDDSLGICPDNWHVPSDDEWTELITYISNDISEEPGVALKATEGWVNNGNGIDYYGFSALPGAYRGDDGIFTGTIGYCGYWWSNTQDNVNAWNYGMFEDYNGVGRNSYNQGYGFSVRCVKNP